MPVTSTSFYADTTKGDRHSSLEFVPTESSGGGFDLPETFQDTESSGGGFPIPETFQDTEPTI